MRKQTKAYITLRDRRWKGTNWFSGFGKYTMIKRLTDEEAAGLDNIELAEFKKQPISGVVGEKDGRMFCQKCGSEKGFYMRKMRHGKQEGWHNMYQCPDCGEREKKMLY